MLASKPPFSASLGMQASQTPTPSYSTGSSHKSASGTKPQEGALFTSPTESEFPEGQDGLEAVR